MEGCPGEARGGGGGEGGSVREGEEVGVREVV